MNAQEFCFWFTVLVVAALAIAIIIDGADGYGDGF
jgi:hypothetical protein